MSDNVGAKGVAAQWFGVTVSGLLFVIGCIAVILGVYLLLGAAVIAEFFTEGYAGHARLLIDLRSPPAVG